MRNLHKVTQPEGHRARAESHPPEPTNSPLSLSVLLAETRTRKGSMGDKPHFRSLTLPFERDLENQPHRGISISFPVRLKQRGPSRGRHDRWLAHEIQKKKDTPSLNYLTCVHQKCRQTHGLHFSFTACKRATEKVNKETYKGSRTFYAEAFFTCDSIPKQKLSLYFNKGSPLCFLTPPHLMRFYLNRRILWDSVTSNDIVQQPKHTNSPPWPSPALFSPRPKHSAQNPHQVSQEALLGLHPLKMFYTHTKLPLVHDQLHAPGISGKF